MLNRIRKINEAMRQHQLSWSLGIFGALCEAFGFLLFVIGGMAVSMGHVSFTPPNVIDPIIADGLGFIFNRWFWAAMLFLGINLMIFGYWSHPDTQLRRKLRNQAVFDFQRNHGWPWED